VQGALVGSAIRPSSGASSTIDALVADGGGRLWEPIYRLRREIDSTSRNVGGSFMVKIAVRARLLILPGGGVVVSRDPAFSCPWVGEQIVPRSSSSKIALRPYCANSFTTLRNQAFQISSFS
jgi:hypothetical protein